MDLKSGFVALISALGSEWISLLQCIIDILLDNHWELLRNKRVYLIQKSKTFNHKVKVWPKTIMGGARVIKTKKNVDIRRKRVY